MRKISLGTWFSYLLAWNNPTIVDIPLKSTTQTIRNTDGNCSAAINSTVGSVVCWVLERLFGDYLPSISAQIHLAVSINTQQASKDDNKCQ